MQDKLQDVVGTVWSDCVNFGNLDDADLVDAGLATLSCAAPYLDMGSKKLCELRVLAIEALRVVLSHEESLGDALAEKDAKKSDLNAILTKSPRALAALADEKNKLARHDAKEDLQSLEEHEERITKTVRELAEAEVALVIASHEELTKALEELAKGHNVEGVYAGDEHLGVDARGREGGLDSSRQRCSRREVRGGRGGQRGHCEYGLVVPD